MISNKRIGRSLVSAFTFASLAMLLIANTSAAQQAQTTAEIRFTATSTNVAQPGDALKINVTRWSTDEERNAFVAAMTPPTPGAGRGGRGRGAPGGADNTDPFGTFGGGRGAAAPPAGGAPPAAAGAAPAAAAGAAAGAPPARGGAARGGGRGGPGGNAPFDPIVSLTTAIAKAPTIGFLWTKENLGYSIKYAYRISGPDGERVILATDRRIGAFIPEVWKPVPATAAAPDYNFTVIEMKIDPKGLGEGKASLNTKVRIDADAKTIALDNYAATPAILKNVKK